MEVASSNASWPALLPYDQQNCQMASSIARLPAVLPDSQQYCQIASSIARWPAVLPDGQQYCQMASSIDRWPADKTEKTAPLERVIKWSNFVLLDNYRQTNLCSLMPCGPTLQSNDLWSNPAV